MEEFTTFKYGGLKEVAGKPKMTLVPYEAIARIAKRFEEGLLKYPKDNWKQGLPITACLDAAARHLWQYAQGETNEDHLAAALWNLVVVCYYEEKFKDDPEINDLINNVKIFKKEDSNHETSNNSPKSVTV